MINSYFSSAQTDIPSEDELLCMCEEQLDRSSCPQQVLRWIAQQDQPEMQKALAEAFRELWKQLSYRFDPRTCYELGDAVMLSWPTADEDICRFMRSIRTAPAMAEVHAPAVSTARCTDSHDTNCHNTTYNAPVYNAPITNNYYYASAPTAPASASAPSCASAEEPSVEEEADAPLPEALRTEEAQALLRKAQAAGLLDADWQPTGQIAHAALLAAEISDRLGLRQRWVVFEQLWSRRNLRNNYQRALESSTSGDIILKIKRLFD